MSKDIQEIAERLRGLREISGITTDQLAQEFGLSSAEYCQYESGQTDIPLSLLFKAASRFEVELTALLTGQDPRLQSYCLIRKGKGLDVERRKAYRYQNLAYNFLHKKAEPFLVTVEPQQGETSVPLNAHPGQEFNYVIEGSLEITLNQHTLVLHEGDSLYFNSSIPHGMQALDGQPARFLAIIL